MPKPLILGGYTPDWGTVTGGRVVGEFRGTGESDELLVSSVDISIGGTFSATIKIQRFIGGNWQTIETITGEAQRFLESKKAYLTKLVCTSFSSGVVQYTIQA